MSVTRSWWSRFGWMIATAVAAALLVGAWAFSEHRKAQHRPQLDPGMCVTVRVLDDLSAQHTVVSCTTPGSFTVVGPAGNGGCAPNLSELTITQKQNSVTQTSVCLIVNVDAGRCYSYAGAQQDNRLAGPTLVPCTDPHAEYRVLSRLEGIGSAQQCPQITNDSIVADAAHFKRTYCLVAPR